MILKSPPCPERIRKTPAQFNWLDHRLVREHYIDKCSHQAAALYLFLVTVADVQGLSYYSEASLTERLSMDSHVLNQARRNLIRVGLIAYKKPIYQVLPLDCGFTAKTADAVSAKKPLCSTSVSDGLTSIKEIFKKITEEQP